MKRIIGLILLMAGIFFFRPGTVSAGGVTVHVFWSATCPHCAREMVFLDALDKKHADIAVKKYEITLSRENAKIFENVGAALQADISGVPFTVVGSKYFVGYYDDQTTGKAIEEAAYAALKAGEPDIVEKVSFGKQEAITPATTPRPQADVNIPTSIRVPLFGTMNIREVSLPVLTVVVALLDGFNPCAMWTLLFLISLLLGMKDRTRMWILGSAFILTSGTVYFLFLSAWLNIFLFLGFVTWVRILIGFASVGAGVYYLRDYLINKDGGCAVMGDTKRQRVFERIKAVAQKQNLIIALAGVVMLAVAVNMVELVCSAGLPAIYTSVLSASHLPVWQYYIYLVAYIVIFMLDDLFVFVTAMVTLQAVGVESKYARYSHLAGGILMLVLGLLLLFRPEWLMFG